MKKCVVVLFAAFSFAVFPCFQTRAETSIVVDLGPYKSAQEAGAAEDGVEWLDADVGDDTVCTECFAACELQRYLRKITGRSGDFVIIGDKNPTPRGDLILLGGAAVSTAGGGLAAAPGVEPEKLAELGAEGYRIKSAVHDGRRVTVIAGGGRAGTLYGVYDFLYRLGCRWFGPGELHEVLPREIIFSDMDVSETPAFTLRGFKVRPDYPPVGEEFFLWMARNRLNYWGPHDEDPALLRKLGIMMSSGGHIVQSLFLDPESPYPYNHAKFEGDEQKPADPYPTSSQFQGDSNRDGKLSNFEAQPQWFPLFRGKRVSEFSGEDGRNFCMSNDDAVAEFVKNYVQSLIDGPFRNADVTRCWVSRSWVGARGLWCECSKCAAMGNRTDRYLRVIHALDQGIKAARREGRLPRPVQVNFLIYRDVLDPPSRPLPEDFDYRTCSGTFFPIYHCYVHNFDDPGCAENDAFCRRLQEWTTDADRHYRGPIGIGEYFNLMSVKCLPINYMHTMANDIPYWRRIGIRQFHYMHVTVGNWGNKSLTNYQMARQLWDVDCGCEALWRDYFDKRYAPAAETMRKFYDSLEKMFCNSIQLKYSLAPRINYNEENLFPDPHLRFRREPGLECQGPTLVEIVEHSQQCRRSIDEALAAELPAAARARIEEDERMFTYGERTVAYLYECAQALMLARAGDKQQARPHLAEARRLAELLRRDTASATMSSQHASAANALEASGASKALETLAKMIETQKNPTAEDNKR